MKYLPDNHYIDLILKGETSAFGNLVNKHKSLVFSIAMKIVQNREDAEEIAQDAFLKAYQSLGSFRGKAKFSTWLYRITYNTAISKTRKKSLFTVDIHDQKHEPPDFSTISDIFDKKEQAEQQDILQQALSKLPEDDQLLITLYYMSERSVEEISEITGLSQSNVKVRLHRIRKKLHDEMTEATSRELTKTYH